jgi:hypothetical protein
MALGPREGRIVIPIVKEIRWLMIFRDGGSMEIDFRGTDGMEYSLLFGIKRVDEYDETGRRTSVRSNGYRKPVLYVREPTEESRGENGFPSGSKSEIEWSDADALLRQLEPLLEAFNSEYKWVHRAMSKTIALDGRSPFPLEKEL